MTGAIEAYLGSLLDACEEMFGRPCRSCRRCVPSGGHGRRCKEVGDFDTCLRIWEEAVEKGIDMGRQGKMLLVEAAMQVTIHESGCIFTTGIQGLAIFNQAEAIPAVVIIFEWRRLGPIRASRWRCCRRQLSCSNKAGANIGGTICLIPPCEALQTRFC
jgi:hypothetical protein